MASSITKLRKAVRKRQDDFEDGTVLRWTSSGRYVYVAVKTPVGWYTSSRQGNPFVKDVLAFDELLDIVARSETSDVEVATGWGAIG